MSSARNAKDGKDAKDARYVRIVAGLLLVALSCALGFVIAYVRGAQTQVEAVLLGVSLGALAAALVLWEHDLMPREESIEERGSLPSLPVTNEAASAAALDGTRVALGRRTWLVRLLATTGGALGIGAFLPLRSLVPADTGPRVLAHTSWTRGKRLVREDGSFVRAADIAVDSIVTVFPEGHVGVDRTDEMANDATVLVRIPPHELRLPRERGAWAPQGLVALSKVCTHAGCPVALYRAAARQLFCPCHQSTFDVLAGGAPIFGPATRALPQLPLAVAEDGTVYAAAGYPVPVGPEYWGRP